jgi:hypothetical protein
MQKNSMGKNFLAILKKLVTVSIYKIERMTAEGK